KKFSYESKFLDVGFALDADDLKGRWASMTSSQRHDFALAFQCKGHLSANDEKIVSFLMHAGERIIWRTIARLLAMHSDREQVVTFLLDRVRDPLETRANYYEAIEVIRDNRSISVLQDQFERYRDRVGVSIAEAHLQPERDSLDYVQLCHTLSKITGNQNYQNEIKRFLSHPSESVRNRARTCTLQYGGLTQPFALGNKSRLLHPFRAFCERVG